MQKEEQEGNKEEDRLHHSTPLGRNKVTENQTCIYLTQINCCQITKSGPAMPDTSPSVPTGGSLLLLYLLTQLYTHVLVGDGLPTVYSQRVKFGTHMLHVAHRALKSINQAKELYGHAYVGKLQKE